MLRCCLVSVVFAAMKTYASVTIESVLVWPDSQDSVTRFSSDKGALREVHDIHENSHIEISFSLDGKAASYKHVGLLLQDKGSTDSIIGTLPSIHVPMTQVAGSTKSFKAVIDLSGMRTVNPEGTTFQLIALIAPQNSTSAVRKDIGKVRLVTSGTRQDPILVSGGRKIVPELASYAPAKVIKHMFKPEPARSSPFYSLVFTIASVSIPTLLLLLGIWKVQVNAKGLVSGEVSRLILTGLTAAFIVLMVAFFAFLNLVQTVMLFLVLIGPLVLVGNRVLCHVRASGDLRDVYSSD